jgi:nucleotide-binding universal stress UspA family protein
MGRKLADIQMKILATFDESPFSEATIPVLTMLAALPSVEIELCSVAEVTPAFDEDAITKRRQELETYLSRIASHLPNSHFSTDVAMYPMDAATVLIGRSEKPDLIVMATHGRSGIARLVLGSVADKVVHSGAAPVLLVRPSRAS